MNEPDFEQQLRAVQPAAPRRTIEERIAAELNPLPRAGALPAPRRSWLGHLLPALGWSTLGATAAIATMLALDLKAGGIKGPVSDIPAPRLSSAFETGVELEHEVLDVADAGIVDGSSDGLARIVRYESVERRRWTGEDGAITVIELPREDLVLVPISFQ